jgi:hypothetical protein
MGTTWRGIGRKTRAIGLCLLAAFPPSLLQGCISPAQYTRPGTNEAQITADTHACAQWAPVVKGAVMGAGYGALAGAAVSTRGAKDRDAAVVALVIGILSGVSAGAVFATEKARAYDRCMLAKGYHAV